MRPFHKSARAVSFAAGIFLSLSGALLFLSSIANAASGLQSSLQAAGGIAFSLLILSAGIAGILSRLSKTEERRMMFLKINGYFLFFFLFLFPFLIGAPVYISGGVLFLGVCGLWIATVIRHDPDRHAAPDR